MKEYVGTGAQAKVICRDRGTGKGTGKGKWELEHE
jgi:hypothetical protein